jgi:PAS domain S-box-containing protein
MFVKLHNVYKTTHLDACHNFFHTAAQHTRGLKMKRIKERGQLKLRQVTLSIDDRPDRRREKLARIVLDEMVQFVGLLTPDGTMLEVNRAAVEGGGQQLAHLIGKPFWEAHWWAVSDAVRAQLIEAIKRAAAGQSSRYDVEVFGSASGEQRITIDFSITPVRDEEGVIVFLLPEGRDITAKKAAEEALARKNVELEQLLVRVHELDEAKSRFFANVSHELRTPLTLIMDPAEQLGADPALGEEARRMVAIIRSNAASLHRRVQELLDMSKLVAGQMQLHSAPTDLARLVQSCCANFDALAAQHQIRYEVRVEALTAQVDAEKIERILLNLLSNAFRHTPPGGQLGISLTHEADQLVLAVEDSGPGVPASMREHIFERFQQGADTPQGGTGLGLTISRELAALHGGALAVEDSARGARFALRLPADLRCDAHAQPRRAADARGELAQLERAASDVVHEAGDPARPLVIVAEDSPQLGELIQSCLAQDYHVLRVGDGMRALELVRAHQPSCLVTDLMMPGMDGESLLRTLAEEGALPSSLVLSARADDAQSEALIASGLAGDYMSKPFKRSELLARVRGLVRQQETLQRLREHEDMLEEAQRIGRVGSWSWDIKSNNISWSRGHYRLQGLSPEDSPPNIEEFVQRILPEDRAATRAALARTMERDEPYDVHMRLRRPDGEVRTLRSRGLLLRDAAGSPARLFGTVQDVTEQRQAEERLKVYETIVRNMGEGVGMVRVSDQHIVYVNPRFASMFGYTPEELEGQHVTIMHPDTDARSAQEEAGQIMEQLHAQGRATYETTNQHRDGRHLICRATTSIMLHPEHGEVWVAVQDDITEQRRGEEALRAMLNDKRVLLQEIHHRVKNNLQVISSMLSLQANKIEDQHARQILGQMQGRVRAIGALHEELYQGKSFARIEADSYIKGLAELIERTMERGSAQRVIVEPGALLLQLQDAMPCALIINELLSNAIKHAGPHATIWISLRGQDGQAVLQVRDDGPGYPPDLDVSKARSMGLSLVRTLTRQLHGVLTCSHDGGACFTIQFPPTVHQPTDEST